MSNLMTTGFEQSYHLQAQKHSPVGIASFVLSVVCGVALFALVVIAGVMEASSPTGMDEQSPAAMILGLALLAFLGLTFIALGLGVGGLLQMNCKKIFAILGIVFSGMTLLGVLGIMAIGFMAG